MIAQATAKLHEHLKSRVKPLHEQKVCISKKLKTTPVLREYIEENYSSRLYEFLLEHVNFNNPSHLVTETSSRFNIIKQPDDTLSEIVNLKRINDIRYLNNFFEVVNSKLLRGGTFIGCVETKNLRKKRILNKYPTGLNYIYYTLDFILKRVFPKLPVTKKIYFFLTRGNNRVITRAETLGRLISCGFQIQELELIQGNLYFVVRKEKAPLFPKNPTYGPLIRLKRVGKGGKIIKVYKLRTMHPYSEYLQDYVYRQNKLQQNGKLKNDYRVCTVGQFLRKYWIDELPMLINFFKGDLKLVGVRPISNHYFNLYSEELKQKRIHHKPGLLPPFYADLPKTMEEIMESELKYLEAYEKHPLKTDWKYFWKVFVNIVFKKARSS
ncbi:MAG: sugar transferase [Salinivirgaceae bacterium]|jgi:lipopolysaccharide/colanic/teichoic acid biosynthesis glycosyltransferase|nr:sugar transferase [Salinivirgaceae bacterium]